MEACREPLAVEVAVDSDAVDDAVELVTSAFELIIENGEVERAGLNVGDAALVLDVV